MTEQEAYEKIGVSQGATKQEIRSAFNKAAFKTHPDYDKTEGATERMQQLNAAKEVLDKLEDGVDKSAKKETQSETYGQQQARSANSNTEEGRKQYSQQYENEGQDREKEERYQAAQERVREDQRRRQQAQSNWNEAKEAANAQRESRDRENSYEKIPTRLHTNLYGSFTDSLKQYRGNQLEPDYYVDLEDILKRMGNLNTFAKYESVVQSIKSPVTIEQIKRSLIPRAKKLLGYYYFGSEFEDKKSEYRKQMRNCLRIILAVLEEKETISDLDTELQIVKTQLNSKEGKELWSELIRPTDLNSRLDIIKAILEGKPIEEIYNEFKAKAEQGREYLKSIGNILRFMTNDSEQEGSQEYSQAA